MSAFHSLHPPVDVELAVDILDMCARCTDGDKQLGRDFRAIQAGVEQVKHFKLASAQGFGQRRSSLFITY